jgi:hypothetical protein
VFFRIGDGVFGKGRFLTPEIEVSKSRIQDALKREGDVYGSYRVSNGRIGVIVIAGPLRSELEHRTDEPIRFDKAVILPGSQAHIRSKTSICIRATPAQPIGDIPEWDAQFYSGGLPSLGKRKP